MEPRIPVVIGETKYSDYVQSVRETYGSFSIEKHKNWYKLENFVSVELPYPLTLPWDDTILAGKFYGHASIANQFLAVLEELRDSGYDEYGGCFSYRNAKSGKGLSVHAYGLAIDFLPSLGKFGQPPETPQIVIDAFKRQGFLWGGDWSTPDGMHWTALKEGE